MEGWGLWACREAGPPHLPGSPIVRQIRQDCAEPFAAFERCLHENQAAVGNCTEHVNRFLLCAERVKPSA
ncbi:coiled-coil-helix-coiled-coil-helix domain-containing protein 5 [Nothoprocta perdicaria]|uniref:coiled-coil-helix-coiled-coil-helix domain-containing protein 5 n=1 Tax=Nothoprocta perdicaria TaxID=30464 RepID=UPI000E1BF24E|nr:coiled-coil-helix-coiled-coil-helix domain-containing protein 5 [Nothoprocta perdicaria]